MQVLQVLVCHVPVCRKASQQHYIQNTLLPFTVNSFRMTISSGGQALAFGLRVLQRHESTKSEPAMGPPLEQMLCNIVRCYPQVERTACAAD